MILCCGEALIDMVPGTTAAGARAFVPRPGGAALNAAVALGRLGSEAGLFSALSGDGLGAELARHLGESGVDLSLCPRVSAPTTLAFPALSAGDAAYSFYDRGTSLNALTEAPALPGRVRAACFGGISLALPGCGATFERTMAALPQDCLRLLDPNIRPALIEEAAPMRARIARMCALADIIKLSDEDLAWLAPTRGAEEEAAALRQGRPKLILVTHGARGASLYTDRDRISLPAPPLPGPLRDTIGAGDTFTAGFLHALDGGGALSPAALPLLSEGHLARALEFACRVAAISVTRVGADPPWRAELAA
jgi:fructokinase